nr:uncharacterized protein LOC129484193 isoform X1 [Symphalangus syndactylus]
MHPTCWTEPLLAFLNPEKSPGSRMKQRVPGTHTGLATTHEISEDCPHLPALQGEVKTKMTFRPKGGREEAPRAHPWEEASQQLARSVMTAPIRQVLGKAVMRRGECAGDL